MAVAQLDDVLSVHSGRSKQDSYLALVKHFASLPQLLRVANNAMVTAGSGLEVLPRLQEAKATIARAEQVRPPDA